MTGVLSTGTWVVLWAGVAAGAGDVEVSAKLAAKQLSVGKEYTINVSLSFPSGVDADGAGIPAPLLQLDVPPSVKLSGKHVSQYRDLARNEFLEEPYERLIKRKSEAVKFTLVKAPKGTERIGLNVLAYVAEKDGSARFLRKRLELPLEAEAAAVAVEPSNSQWGTSKTLQIGDDAPDFSLPVLTGGNASLADFRGKKNVIVTTYRAHW